MSARGVPISGNPKSRLQKDSAKAWRAPQIQDAIVRLVTRRPLSLNQLFGELADHAGYSQLRQVVVEMLRAGLLERGPGDDLGYGAVYRVPADRAERMRLVRVITNVPPIDRARLSSAVRLLVATGASVSAREIVAQCCPAFLGLDQGTVVDVLALLARAGELEPLHLGSLLRYRRAS